MVKKISVLSFLNINDWVKVLLLYYAVFWCIYALFPKLVRRGIWQDILMCFIVAICSLIDYFTEFKITYRWIVEPLGFAYGIIAAILASEIKRWIGKNWIGKSILLLIISGVLGSSYLRFKPVLIWGDYVLKIILGIAITAFMFAIIGKINFGNKANAFLGSISYEVYLLHHGVFALLMAIDVDTMNSGLFVVVSVCITIIIAYCLKKICTPIKIKISNIGG